MSIGLQITAEEKGNKIIVRIQGRLDAPSSPALERRLNGFIEEGKLFFILDFSSVDYLSSAGMRLLLSMTKKLKAKKGSFAIFGVNDELMEIIKMAGLDRLLSLYDSEEKAFQV